MVGLEPLRIVRVCFVWLIMKSMQNLPTEYKHPLEQLLDPPAICLCPNRKDQLSKFNKYGYNHYFI